VSRPGSLPGSLHSPHGAWRCTLGGVTSVPIVVHRPSLTGGRRVTVHRHGRDEILGTAYSDHDLVVFLERAGIANAEDLLDQPQWVEWRDGPAHDFSAA
jgi:hypothetical protein